MIVNTGQICLYGNSFIEKIIGAGCIRVRMQSRLKGKQVRFLYDLVTVIRECRFYRDVTDAQSGIGKAESV